VILVLGLVKTALELVPAEIVQDVAVVTSAKLRGKPPQHILLDEALHSKALQTLPNAKNRGRPDIAHRSLLTALDSVLAREGQLELFIHTYSEAIIQITPGTRLPRRIARFLGLMEQLLVSKQVPPKGPPLMQVFQGTLQTYLQEISPTTIYLLSHKGTPTSPSRFTEQLISEEKPVVLVGGFPHDISMPTLTNLVDHQISFDPKPLPTTTIVSMLIHSVEIALNLPMRRFQQQK
jgi:rRNA small subunit pseudouridine methyltransferase Nep1